MTGTVGQNLFFGSVLFREHQRSFPATSRMIRSRRGADLHPSSQPDNARTPLLAPPQSPVRAMVAGAMLARLAESDGEPRGQPGSLVGFIPALDGFNHGFADGLEPQGPKLQSRCVTRATAEGSEGEPDVLGLRRGFPGLRVIRINVPEVSQRHFVHRQIVSRLGNLAGRPAAIGQPLSDDAVVL